MKLRFGEPMGPDRDHVAHFGEQWYIGYHPDTQLHWALVFYNYKPGIIPCRPCDATTGPVLRLSQLLMALPQIMLYRDACTCEEQ